MSLRYLETYFETYLQKFEKISISFHLRSKCLLHFDAHKVGCVSDLVWSGPNWAWYPGLSGHCQVIPRGDAPSQWASMPLFTGNAGQGRGDRVSGMGWRQAIPISQTPLRPKQQGEVWQSGKQGYHKDVVVVIVPSFLHLFANITVKAGVSVWLEQYLQCKYVHIFVRRQIIWTKCNHFKSHI